MFAAFETKYVHRNRKLALGIFIFRNCRLTSFAKKWLVKIIVVELKIVCSSRVAERGEISVNVQILSLSVLCLNINACKVVLSYFSSLVHSPFHVSHSRVTPVVQKKRSFPITGVIEYTQLAQRGPPRAAARYDDDSVRPGSHHQAVAHREESRSTSVLIYLYSSYYKHSCHC